MITDLLNWYPFSIIYIADLDAIERQADNSALYQTLVQLFPNVTFWLDAGIKSQICWQKLSRYSTIKPIIGSETLIGGECLLSNIGKDDGILSLDFKNGDFLGEVEILQTPDLWTQRVIVMELDWVGEQAGPNINHLLELKQKGCNNQIIAAGGIRNKGDLVELAAQGIKQVLVASALHNGSIIKSELVW
ncbi:MAG: HisA/HisF-related TIM barrel protein [Gammaproteobacteria bacterium]|nr:HisA/HisF-related TIM barrel protein [Gammaproteobacteria bacterium]